MTRAAMPRRRRATQQLALDPAKAGIVLRAHGFIASQGDPVSAWGRRDGQERWRRIHAEYSDGWRVTLVFYADDTFSMSQAIRLVSRGPR